MRIGTGVRIGGRRGPSVRGVRLPGRLRIGVPAPGEPPGGALPGASGGRLVGTEAVGALAGALEASFAGAVGAGTVDLAAGASGVRGFSTGKTVGTGVAGTAIGDSVTAAEVGSVG